MDISKHFEFFDPSKVNDRIHIIGCGSVGSVLAENLARLGLTKFTLYDFDIVEAKNIANQMFVQSDIGTQKVDAVARIMTDINPDIANELVLCREGYTGQRLSGYVFLCPDSIDVRRKIVEDNMENASIKAVFDFRTGLTFAQHFSANWQQYREKKNLLNSMQFTHEEAKLEAPVSACNIEQSVAPTIRVIVALGVSNFMNFAIKGTLKKLIQSDAFGYVIEAY